MAENMEQQMRAMEHPPSPGKDALFKTPGKSKNVKRESQGTASPFLKSTPKAPVVLPKNNQGVTTVQDARARTPRKAISTSARSQQSAAAQVTIVIVSMWREAL